MTSLHQTWKREAEEPIFECTARIDTRKCTCEVCKWKGRVILLIYKLEAAEAKLEEKEKENQALGAYKTKNLVKLNL